MRVIGRRRHWLCPFLVPDLDLAPGLDLVPVLFLVLALSGLFRLCLA